MHPITRALCWLVLLAPALASAQTSFPRCSNTRIESIVIRGGNGCREDLPEPPPPAPVPQPPPPTGEVSLEAGEAALAPPIWLDFDPRLVPGWNERLMVGVDLRKLPSIYSAKETPGEEDVYTFLEVAFRAGVGGPSDYDVLRFRADNGSGYGQVGIAIEHWMRYGSSWSVLDQTKASLLAVGTRPMEDGPIEPHSAVLEIWNDRAGLNVSLNGTPILISTLSSKNARMVRVRRGIFGPAAIYAGESIGLEWIEPNFGLITPPSVDDSRGE
jgi:hypothetical protein